MKYITHSEKSDIYLFNINETQNKINKIKILLDL